MIGHLLSRKSLRSAAPVPLLGHFGAISLEKGVALSLM